MRARIEHNIFDRPLYLQSSESSDMLQGDIFALVDYSHDEVRHALAATVRRHTDRQEALA